MKQHISIFLSIILLLSCIAVFSACSNEELYDSPEPSASTMSLIPPYESLGTTSTTTSKEQITDSEVLEEPPAPKTSVGLEFEKDSHNPHYVVSGIGTCTDSTVYIPEEYDGLPVKAIGPEAFEYCTSFNKMILPDTIEIIGYNAFHKCTSLAEITLSSNLRAIGEGAFWLSGLTSITLTSNIEEIGESAFRGCEFLNSVTFSSSGIKSIPEVCFAWCSSLQSITLPDGVTSIGQQAFYECTALSNITLPKTLETLDFMCFSNCTSLRKIRIPETTSDIYPSAFSGCINLDIYCYADINLSGLEGVTGTVHYYD